MSASSEKAKSSSKPPRSVTFASTHHVVDIRLNNISVALRPNSPAQRAPKRSLKADGIDGGYFRMPASTPTRLIIGLHLGPMIGRPRVFEDDFAAKLPPEVIRASNDQITPEEWAIWMGKFKAIVQKHTLSFWVSVILWFSIIGLPLWIYKYGKLQREAQEWQEDVNMQLFHPHGMYIKTQASTWEAPFTLYGIVSHWFAIALTEEESVLLEKEEHLWYYNPHNETHYTTHGMNRQCQSIFACGMRKNVTIVTSAESGSQDFVSYLDIWNRDMCGAKNIRQIFMYSHQHGGAVDALLSSPTSASTAPHADYSTVFATNAFASLSNSYRGTGGYGMSYSYGWLKTNCWHALKDREGF
ncbi:hypothetical protein BJ742DRAFT_741875 [Cladochytrium replicatum]|nr:hypothetical protein BJ742DRAFT_741875 [Cladochytrium replicatum]